MKREDCLKKRGGGAWTVCRFMEDLTRKRGAGVFLREDTELGILCIGFAEL